MRYLAQRIGTGEWLHRDLPLSGVTRTRELSGPGSITATIDPELRDIYQPDKLRLLEDWATVIYCADDSGSGQIRNAGIVVPATEYTGDATKLTCAGYSSYPHGYYYASARNWGPAHAVPATAHAVAQPEVPRPDPLQIFQDHWSWIQQQQDSDLGVTVVGTLKSTVRIGDYKNPYKLQWWNSVDLGQEMDNLAQNTPFDYVEEHSWADAAQTQVSHRVRLGWPRLGRRRDDLRFASGENVTAAITADTVDEYANDVIGIGNGSGSAMAYSRATRRDGRLRRTKIVTDKTANQAAIDRETQSQLQRLAHTIDITSVTIADHPNARISSIGLGDDILVQTEIPSYGDIALWVRVLSITEGEDQATAQLNTQRSTAFFYNTDESVA